jgi:predicted transcriptional regulator
MADAQTKYKLIILYMLRKVTFPLSNSQITEFMIEKEYTDYFHIQEALNDLVDSKLIVLDQIRNTTQYEATLDGEKTLEYFSYMISNDIKAEIDAYMRDNAFELRNESSTRADYRQTGNGDYAVTCTVKEGNESLIDLTFTVPMEEEAERVFSKWPEKSQEIYMYIMEKLL